MVLEDMMIFSNKDKNPLLKMHGQRQKLKHRFDVIHKLGQGTYGKVQLGVDKDSGQQVAIKTIKKSKIETQQDLIRIKREIQIMSCVQHPHIIHIYEVFENKDKIVLVMQYASGGELYDYLNEKKVLSEADARRLFRQIASAVYYCHKHKICHRDLKLENIFLDEKGNAKIGDFGLSNIYSNRGFLTTFCGSPLYASPEIVQGTPYYGPEVDCWSLGVLLYTLVYGAMPFDGSNFKRLVRQISEGDYYEPKKKSEASGLIRDILTVSPAKRANIVDICSHWWVNQECETKLTDIAEDLANLTPVRLDFLFALDQPEISNQEDNPAPSDCDEANKAQANGIMPSATEPVNNIALDQIQQSSPDKENKDHLINNQQNVSSSDSVKRRSLSVPDIAERVMDLFVNETNEQSNKETLKRREENDSRNIIAQKKKPRMGVSALAPSTEDITQDTVMGSASEIPVQKEVLDVPEKQEAKVSMEKELDVSISVEKEEISVANENEKIATENADENNEPVNSSQVTEAADTSSDMKSLVIVEPVCANVRKDRPEAKKETSPAVANKDTASAEPTKETSPAAKKSVKGAKPNLVKRVKKKSKEPEKEGSPKTLAEAVEGKITPKAKESRVVKRPKKLSIPKPIPQPESIPTPEKIKVPGKISDLKKAFEGKKAAPKRPLIVPSRTVSDAKKAFEVTSPKESSSPPILEGRRRSSTTSLNSKKSSNSQSPVSTGPPKKESSPLHKECSPKATTNKVKVQSSKSPTKSLKKTGSKSPVKSPPSQESNKSLKDSNVKTQGLASTTEELNVNKNVQSQIELSSKENVDYIEDASSASRKSSSDGKADDEEELSQTVSELFIREDGDELPERDTNKVANKMNASSDDDGAEVLSQDEQGRGPVESFDEDLKSSAKDILKRNIAKAKLNDRKMSNQNSLPEESNPPSSSHGDGFYTPPVGTSAFRLPKSFQKEDQQKVSKAEITLKPNSKQSIDEPVTDSSTKLTAQTKPNRSDTEERLKDSRRGSIAASESDSGHAITKSYRKFTFTKDGKCIEETGKIFQNDPEGEWTTIKTTKVSQAPKPNFEETERLPPRVERSDSASSSGPDDIFEDFFDSFTGDSMFFGLKRMNSLVKKHFGRHHPLFQKHSSFDRGSPFRRMGSRRRSSSQSRNSSQTDFNSQESDFNSVFDFGSPFNTFGSQNIHHLLENFGHDTDDFFQNKFSTLGHRSKFADRDSSRSSLFDRFMSPERRPNSAFGRSASSDRGREPSPNSRSSFTDSRLSFQKPTFSRQSTQCSPAPPFSCQSSQLSGENIQRNVDSDFSRPYTKATHSDHSGSQTHFYASPEYARQNSLFSSAQNYSRQGSQFSTPEYSRQSSQFSSAPEHERQGSQFSPVSDYNRARGYPPPAESNARFSSSSDLSRGRPHVTTHAFSSTANDKSDPHHAAQQLASGGDITRKTSTPATIYSLQTSQSSSAAGNSSPKTSLTNDGGFKATIRLSRSGFEPPNVEHSVHGAIRPHIRIRYTRSGSGGVSETGYTSPDTSNVRIPLSKPDSKCEDGVHCGTPERDLDGSQCTDGKHCGTPPPPEKSSSNDTLNKRTIKVDSPSIYGTMRPCDIRKYVQKSNSSLAFEARPDNEEPDVPISKTKSLSRNGSLESNDGTSSSRSKSKSPTTNNGIEESLSTMSLLESLKTLGYTDVMKSRQSQEDLYDAKIIADVRAKRLAGESSGDRLNMLSSHSFNRHQTPAEQNPSKSNMVTNPTATCSNAESLNQTPGQSLSQSNLVMRSALLCPDDRRSRAKSEEAIKPVMSSPKGTNEEKIESCDHSSDIRDERSRCGSEEPSNDNSESVSERIRRKSYFTRFNDDRPRRNKKSSLISDSRRSSGYFNSSFEDSSQLKPSLSSSLMTSNRRVSYSSSLSQDSSFDKPTNLSHWSPKESPNNSSSNFDTSARNILKNNTDWFQEADARATQLFDEMYEHDARMLQSLPVRGHRSSRRLSSESDKRSRRPRHYDDFQPSSGYLSNLHKQQPVPENNTQNPSSHQPQGGFTTNHSANYVCDNKEKLSSLMDSFDKPREVLQKAMDLLNC